jgi:hypothetical protein
VSGTAQQKTPERFSVSPEGFPATNQIDQAACFRFLRQPIRPNAPKPVAKIPRDWAEHSRVISPASM